MSEYRIIDMSDEDGGDYTVEDEFGELGRFFDRAEAETFLANLKWVAAIDAAVS